MIDPANDLQLHEGAICDRCGEPLTLSNIIELDNFTFICTTCVTDKDHIAKYEKEWEK